MSGPSSSERRAGYTPTIRPEQRPAASVRAPTVAMLEVTGTTRMKVPAPARPAQYHGHLGGNLSDRAGPVRRPSKSPTAKTEIQPALSGLDQPRLEWRWRGR